jgi:hypothetical protein
MRYLVHAKLKPEKEQPLLDAIDASTLGAGSVAGDEYLHNMREARACPSGVVKWVEVCYCPTPLQEERPYWEEYFELVKVQDAHLRANCRDENGSEPWACSDCDCTRKLENCLRQTGEEFVPRLRSVISHPESTS